MSISQSKYFKGKNSTWWRPCPAGTYGNETGLSKETQCQECDPGYYCEGINNTQPTSKCAAGLIIPHSTQFLILMIVL